MKPVKTLIVILTLATPGSLFAEATFGQASDIFNVGAGARALGMGSAFTGLADDASAPYYNPAGLAYLDEHQLMGMYAPLFLDTNYNYLSSAHPFGDKWGSVAISDSLLLSDGIKARDSFNNVTDSNAEVRNNALFVSYARKIWQRLSVGVNTKYIQQKVHTLSDSTLGLDLGAMYVHSNRLRLGVSFSNVNEPSVKLQSASDKYRPISRIGLASDLYKNRLTLTADAIKTSKQKALYAAGLEFKLNHLIQLRTGLNANREFAAGLGLKFNTVRVDYAFSNNDLGAFNKVSFTWAWHNIYETQIEPPLQEGRAVYPLSGFKNEVVFVPQVPNHYVANWSLVIKSHTGEVVKTLEADLRPPKTIVWDGRNNIGQPSTKGTYTYDFIVNYKNGKKWMVDGNLDLYLPNQQIEEVIDMNLDLNGENGPDELGYNVAPLEEAPLYGPQEPEINE